MKFAILTIPLLFVIAGAASSDRDAKTGSFARQSVPFTFLGKSQKGITTMHLPSSGSSSVSSTLQDGKVNSQKKTVKDVIIKSLSGGGDSDASLGGLVPKILIAKVAVALSMVSAGYIVLAPHKALEFYGFETITPLVEYIIECIGDILTTLAITRWCIVYGNKTKETAVGSGILYSALFSVKSLLNEKPKELGFSKVGQYIFLIVNAVCGVGLLNDVSYSDKILTYYPIFGIVNALGFLFATDMMTKNWGIEQAEGSGILADEVKALVKGNGVVLLSKSIYTVALAMGSVDNMKALGYSYIPGLIDFIIVNFVTKSTRSLGLDAAPQYIWMVLFALFVGTLAF